MELIEPDWQSTIRELVEGEIPHIDGFWYSPDEDGILKYKSRKITEGEQSALDQAEDTRE